MLEAAGGGGGTDWWGMSMERIHSVSQNPDIDAQYQIVDGWQKSADLISTHMGQVQDYRDALATAWPPEKSTAAKAYLDRLDGLLKNLNETYEATLANRDALSSASLSLSLAKTEMSQVYSQWDTNNKTLLAFNQQQAQKSQQASSGHPTPSPSPSGDEPPPVTASQQDALRQRAITLMSGVSSDLAEAQLKIVRPAPYTPEMSFDKGTDPSGTGSTNVPVLPPIVPTSYSTGSGSPSGRSSFSPSNGSTTPVGTPATGGSSFAGSGSGNPGLVLGGANPQSTLSPPATGINPATGLPAGGGPITTPGILPPSPNPFLPGGKPPSSANNFPGEGDAFRPGGGLPEGGLKAMPPGGIIGRTPAGGYGESGATRFGTQRVNPVGGVIGEQGSPIGNRGVGGLNGEGIMGGGGRAMTGARGGSTARAGMRGSAYGQVGGRRSSRRDQSDDTRWDPDNPWATEEGVDPIVLPVLEQRIDPGPAIGLG